MPGANFYTNSIYEDVPGWEPFQSQTNQTSLSSLYQQPTQAQSLSTTSLTNPAPAPVTSGNWWDGLAAADGRIGGASILDQGSFGLDGVGTQGWAYDAINHGNGTLEAFVRALGQGSLWDSGYTPGSGVYTGLFDQNYSAGSYSQELQDLLNQYDYYRIGARPGENDSTRHSVAIDKNTGQAAWGNTYGYDRWWEAPLEAAAVLGTAYLGGQLGGALLGGETAAAGAAGSAGAGSIPLSGTLPLESVISMSQVPTAAQIGGAAGGALGGVSMGESLGALPSAAGGGMEAGGALSGGAATGSIPGSSVASVAGSLPANTNPAIIESTVGTPGYGASSGVTGTGVAGNGLGLGQGGIGMSGLQTSIYDQIMAQSGGNAQLANAITGALTNSSGQGIVPGLESIFSGGNAVGGSSSFLSSLTEMLGGLNSSLQSTNGVLGNLAGLWSANQSRNDLKAIEDKMLGMYSQDSPYAQTMRQELDRRDAAAGRRSQYGPRAVELQAKLADATQRSLATIYGMQDKDAQYRNQMANNVLQGINSAGGLGSILGGLGGLFQNIPSWFDQLGGD